MQTSHTLSSKVLISIEDVKKEGQIKNLIEYIDYLKFFLTSMNWDFIKKDAKYIRLQDAINNAEFLLNKMQVAFEELKQLDSTHE